MHSEWSWDAPYTSMERACLRATKLGVPSIAFTEHVDTVPRTLGPSAVLAPWQREFVIDGVLTPPTLDVAGYLRCLKRCRERFPRLRVLSGVELGEPHLPGSAAPGVLARTRFDRVLASVHTLAARDEAGRTPVDTAFATTAAPVVVRDYLREVAAMLTGAVDFDALAHLDYAARYWPGGTFPLAEFEPEYRTVLAQLAAAGRALEVNTRVAGTLDLVRWWREEGGRAITFASDAHRPEHVARGLSEAAAFAAAAGFAPGRHPHDPWEREDP